MDYENIFFQLPNFLQIILVNLKSFYIKHTRYDKQFFKYLSYYRNSDMHLTDINQLESFIRFASHTKYWSRIFKEYQFNIDSDNLEKELLKLPVISKDEARLYTHDIQNTARISKKILVHTSGTTGGGMVFPSTREMEQRQWAIWWRYRKWHGIEMNTWMAWFGGRLIISIHKDRPPYWRVSYSTRQVMFSQFHLNLDTVELYYNELISRKIKWLHGYPSQIALLAKLIKEKGYTGFPDLSIITIGAENFMEHQRLIISEVFDVPVRQHYGLAEGVANISEDEEGNLCVDKDFCCVELIPFDETNSDKCRIIGTNYNNVAFPLIRYDTGDIAHVQWMDDNTPKIISIEGRNEDYITLKNGVRLGRLDHIFKNLTHIVEAQIFQSSLDLVVVRIVKDPMYDEENEEEKLLKEIEKRFSDWINVEIEYLERIQRTQSGKLKFVISLVK